MKLSERIQIHSGEADPKQSETPIGRDVLDEWAAEVAKLEEEVDALKQALLVADALLQMPPDATPSDTPISDIPASP